MYKVNYYINSAIAVHMHQNNVIDQYQGNCVKVHRKQHHEISGGIEAQSYPRPSTAFIEQIKLDDNREICYTDRKEKRHAAKKQIEEHQNNLSIAMRATQPIFIQVHTAISRKLSENMHAHFLSSRSFFQPSASLS